MSNLNYERSGLNIEITIRDESMAKIETFKCSANDFHKIAHILYKKYGIKYKPEVDFPLGFKKPKDLQWTNAKENV